MKYTLMVPIQFGSETITELTIREKVVAGDMRGIEMRQRPLHDDIMKLAGRLTGQPDPVIQAMAFADYIEVANLVAGFIDPGPATGNTPSPS
jgi:hypothetical protein